MKTQQNAGFCTGATHWRNTAQAVALSLLLQVLPLRRASGENNVDSKFLYYEEEHGRMKVYGPSISSEVDLSSTLTLKVGALYNAISGASPTGAPPEAATQKAILTPSGAITTVSGASKPTSSLVLLPGASLITVPNPNVGKLPTGSSVDERYSGNIEVAKRFGDSIISALLYYSTERDYRSIAGTVTYTREFNKKNTILNLGASYGHDSVDVFSQGNTQAKHEQNYVAGVTQVLDAKTVLEANFTLGFVNGYLGDGYKYAEVNGDLLPERRPGHKNKQTGYISLRRYIDSLNGSVEASYRIYRDSFGVVANTVALKWHQKLGPSVLLTPFVRYYTQTAADFYDISFTGLPEYYSADYRLSDMSSFSQGVEISWSPRDWLSLDASYERYSMWGNDGKTSSQAYPKANIITAGFRIRF